MSLSHAFLSVTSNGSEIRVQCKIGNADKTEKTFSQTVLSVDRAALAHRISKIKNVLSEDMTNIWANLPNPLAHPDETNNPKYVAERFKECMDSTLNEGSTLFLELSNNCLKEIMSELDKMPDGSTLSIDTDCAFLPFEILTSKSFTNDPNAPPMQDPSKPEDMWGYRFIIDYNVKTNGTQEVGSLLAQHLNSKPFIGINLNPTIDDAFQGKPFMPLKRHEMLYKDDIKDGCGEVDLVPKSILGKLVSSEYKATMIYLYCHGSNSNPFEINNDELLQLDEKFTFDPSLLQKYPNQYPHAPIVFLNSCLSGQPSPLSFTSFQAVFRRKNALGFIGTAIKMPATFAAAFGCRLIKDYLQGAPLGVAIWKLRRELVDKGNPLGLFYTLQCPSDVVVGKS